MKRIVVFILLVLWSCDYFENKKIETKDIVEQELQSINWKDVDEYPTFSVCDSVSGKQERKGCFEATVLKHVNSYLSNQHIVVSEDVADTIFMNLAIDKLGNISIINLEINSHTRQVLPEIDSLLRGSVLGLPKIYPAIKRRQQVNTEFVLPINLVIQ